MDALKFDMQTIYKPHYNVGELEHAQWQEIIPLFMERPLLDCSNMHAVIYQGVFEQSDHTKLMILCMNLASV